MLSSHLLHGLPYGLFPLDFSVKGYMQLFPQSLLHLALSELLARLEARKGRMGLPVPSVSFEQGTFQTQV